jgi:hypothetical protein
VTASVDVLAVLDAARARMHVAILPTRSEMAAYDEARSAVAELVEMSRGALATLDAIRKSDAMRPDHSIADYYPDGFALQPLRAALARFVKA